MADVVDDANDKHMKPWADLCAVRLPVRAHLGDSEVAHDYGTGPWHQQYAADSIHRQGTLATQPLVREWLED